MLHVHLISRMNSYVTAISAKVPLKPMYKIQLSLTGSIQINLLFFYSTGDGPEQYLSVTMFTARLNFS